MLDICTGWRKFETKIGDYPVTMEVRPLTVDDMIELSPFLGVNINQNDLPAMIQQTLKMQKMAVKIFTDYVRGIEGLMVNGEPPTPEVISTTTKLANFAGEVISHIVVISSLGEDELKKSEGASGG